MGLSKFLWVPPIMFFMRSLFFGTEPAGAILQVLPQEKGKEKKDKGKSKKKAIVPEQLHPAPSSSVMSLQICSAAFCLPLVKHFFIFVPS